MISTPEFWVSVAFVLLFVLFGKRAYTFMTQILDDHSRKVTEQLEKAESLQKEALSLLNSYKEKYDNALEQAEKIIAHAEREAEDFKSQSENELEKFIAQKEKALSERLALQREEAKAKLTKEASDLALKIVEEKIMASPATRKKITKTALQDVTKINVVSQDSSLRGAKRRGNL